jgi:hypothetical protein
MYKDKLKNKNTVCGDPNICFVSSMTMPFFVYSFYRKTKENIFFAQHEGIALQLLRKVKRNKAKKSGFGGVSPDRFCVIIGNYPNLGEQTS